MDWIETTTDINNQHEQQQKYSGVFTVTLKQPTSQKSILQNPLGLYIVNFNISQREV
jgi:type IV secretory pathway TrbF-like protein